LIHSLTHSESGSPLSASFAAATRVSALKSPGSSLLAFFIFYDSNNQKLMFIQSELASRRDALITEALLIRSPPQVLYSVAPPLSLLYAKS
jgi:hypothetical protein